MDNRRLGARGGAKGEPRLFGVDNGLRVLQGHVNLEERPRGSGLTGLANGLAEGRGCLCSSCLPSKENTPQRHPQGAGKQLGA